MKKLINLANFTQTIDKFNEGKESLEDFLKQHNIDAVELMLYEEDIKVSKEIVHGLHLRTWSYWMDFWKGNHEALLHNLISKENIHELYNGSSSKALVDWYKKEFEIAKSLNVRYMVMHIADMDIHDIYTGDYRYTDEEIVSCAVDLINEAFKKDSDILLLFENMWGPGIRFDKPDLMRQIYEKVNYKNKGFLFDLSHFALSQNDVYSLDELKSSINTALNQMGELRKYIYGMHVSACSLGNSVEKMREGFDYKSPLLSSSLEDRYIHNLTTVGKLDMHRPFEDELLKDIIDIISPEFIVYEFLYQSKDTLSDWIKTQNSYL